MRVIISIITLLLAGCASNLPYADIDDAMELQYGMNKTKVENILGPPVKLKGTGTEEIWLYDYRLLENSRFEWMSPVKGDNPTKINGPSEFYCTFNNNQLTKWGSCIGECNEESSHNSFQSGVLSKIWEYKYPILGIAALAIIIPMLTAEEASCDSAGVMGPWTFCDK